ncbi:MAG: AAA family ATPase [Chloroflexota bacterium]|nr:ParA family protein [Chloroflexota bacterium]
MSKKIAVANQKGGVGKTTTTINLGAALAEKGYKVLLVDLDSQANLTTSLGINPVRLTKSVFNLLTSEATLEEIIQTTSLANIQVLPGHIDLSAADRVLNDIGRERVLQKKLTSKSLDHYDFILFDCGPTLNITTINALTAADFLIIPVQSEPMALYGLGHLINTIKLVQENTNPQLTVMGVLITMYVTRLSSSQEVLELVRRDFGELLFKTLVRQRNNLTEMPARQLPITEYAGKTDAAEDYRNLAKEVLERVG